MSRHVVDNLGRQHTLGRRIGRGGQGEVFAAVSGRLAVKLLYSRSEQDRTRFERRLRGVGRLPLEGLPLAMPLGLLRKPHIGYVMDLMTGMEPIESLMQPPAGAEGRVLDWYAETGGLRRRLRVLAHAAEALAVLHGRGLAYGDLSAGNLLVSREVSEAEASLIDSDNVAYLSEDPGETVFTPDFAAPELVRGERGVTTLSDSFAFAVVAFRTLTLVHPFHGDVVENGPPECLEQARAGELSWIEHENGENASSLGLSRADVLSRHLMACLRATFERGLRDRTERPGLAKWVEVLHTAADNTVVCDVCRSTRYRGPRPCPWCGSRSPRSTLLEVGRWEPSLTGEERRCALPRPATISAAAGEAVAVTRRISEVRSGLNGREVVLTLDVDDEWVRVRALAGHPAWLREGDRSRWMRLGSSERTLPIEGGSARWEIHFGAPETSHRFVSVRR